MEFFIYILVFVLGLLSGSFLNCAIYRLNVKDNFLKGRSYCPRCKKTISFLDLIPIFSFFFLKGKCRYCFSKISWQYPIVETITGLIFLSVFLFAQANNLGFLNIFYYWIIALLFILVFVYDLKHFIIPDLAVISAVFVSFIWHLFNLLNGVYSFEVLVYYFLSGIGASFFFLSFYLISKGNWMGFGDVKFAFAMGFFLGFPEIAIALFLSFLIGAIVGVLIIALKKKNIKSEIPFAPFLVIGSFLAFFLGEQILTQYLMFFRIY